MINFILGLVCGFIIGGIFGIFIIALMTVSSNSDKVVNNFINKEEKSE